MIATQIIGHVTCHGQSSTTNFVFVRLHGVTIILNDENYWSYAAQRIGGQCSSSVLPAVNHASVRQRFITDHWSGGAI
jgi:hypothetical protein